MIILEDTRQKDGEHRIKHTWFADHGIDLMRSKLAFGDYALPPSIAVDTKKDMDEICGNICSKDNRRFREECIRAQKAGCKLIFLIENKVGISSIDEVHTWINPRIVYSPRCPQGPQLEKAMKTIQSKYGCEFRFCKPEESAAMIQSILQGGDHNGG